MLLLLLVSSNNILLAQNVGINDNGSLPHTSAGLDIDFSNKGFLLPRLTTQQRNSIQNPAFGLQIYNTDSDCIEGYFATNLWKPIQCGCSTPPNIPSMIISNQHFCPGGTGVFQINTSIQFTSQTYPNASYSWLFEDINNQIITSIQTTPSYTWTTAGQYNINLTITDSSGCSSSTTQQINITNCISEIFSFNNCNKVGRIGTYQAECNSSYTNTNLSGSVSATNGIQSWSVPITGNYIIRAAGAQGGGGTFVYNSTYPLIIAGGGGGIGAGNSVRKAGRDASASTTVSNVN